MLLGEEEILTKPKVAELRKRARETSRTPELRGTQVEGSPVTVTSAGKDTTINRARTPTLWTQLIGGDALSTAAVKQMQAQASH